VANTVAAGCRLHAAYKRFNQWLVAVLVLLLTQTPVFAFDELTPAQQLIYDAPHLANTEAGQTLVYGYSSQFTAEPAHTDQIKLSIKNAVGDDKRDVSLQFLSGENRMPLPDFDGFRGNPVIIGMLEHVAQSIGNETGGGVLYFRNRIRDALAAETTKIQDTTVTWNDSQLMAKKVVLEPFSADPYLAEKPEYRHTTISILMSEDVPGGVLRISVKSETADELFFAREFELQATGA